MGYASHKIGYEGYTASNDVIVSDATEYTSFGGGGTTNKITGSILSDVSDVSTLRIKMSLKHDQLTHNIRAILIIGGRVVWDKQHVATDVNYHDYTLDVPVTWVRGDNIKVTNEASANTGYMKDFQICGKISPLGLD